MRLTYGDSAAHVALIFFQFYLCGIFSNVLKLFVLNFFVCVEFFVCGEIFCCALKSFVLKFCLCAEIFFCVVKFEIEIVYKPRI